MSCIMYSVFIVSIMSTSCSFQLLLKEESLYALLLLPDPGKTRGCSTNTTVTVPDLLSKWVSHPLPLLALRRRKAQTVWDGASSHQNFIIGSKVTACFEHSQYIEYVPGVVFTRGPEAYCVKVGGAEPWWRPQQRRPDWHTPSRGSQEQVAWGQDLTKIAQRQFRKFSSGFCFLRHTPLEKLFC